MKLYSFDVDRFAGTEVEERALDQAEDASLRHRIGEQGEGHRPWPVWSYAGHEQPPFRSQLTAARWLDAHDEDGHDHDWGDET